MVTVISPDTVAEHLIEFLNKNGSMEEDGSQVHLADLKDTTISSDFIQVEQNLSWDTFNIDAKFTGYGIISGLIVSWSWTEDLCTKLIFNVGTVSLKLSKKREEESSTLETREKADEISGKCNCTDNDVVEGGKSLTTEHGDHNTISDTDYDPRLLLEWFAQVAPVTEINVDSIDVAVEDELSPSEARNIVLTMLQTGVLGALLHYSQNTPSNGRMFPLIISQLVTINYSSDTGSKLLCHVGGMSCCGPLWYADEVVIKTTLLGLQLQSTSSGIKMDFSSTSFEAKVDKISAFRIFGGGFRTCLKEILTDTSVDYDGKRLLIKLTSSLVLSNATEIREEPSDLCFQVPFDIQFGAPSVHLINTNGPIQNITLDNLVLSVIPSNSAPGYTPVSCVVDKLSLDEHFVMDDVSIECSPDITCSEIHAFRSKLKSASFHVTNESILMLNALIKHLKEIHCQVKMPYAHLQPVAVIISIHRDVIHEFEAYTGDGESNLPDLFVNFAERLREEVDDRRRRSKERREELADSVAVTTGTALLHASASTPVGFMVAVAALGVRDGVGAAVMSGKEARGASEHDRYKFGDLTRGLSRKLWKRATDTESVEPSQQKKEASVLEDKQRVRFAGVKGTSVGAVVGSFLGPVGLIAGGVIGERVAKARARRANNERDDEQSDPLEGGD